MANQEGSKGCKKARRSNDYYYTNWRRDENKIRKERKNAKRVARLKARQERLVKQGILIRVEKTDGTYKYLHKDKIWSEQERYNRKVKALTHFIEVDAETGHLIPLTTETGHYIGVVKRGFRGPVTQGLMNDAIAMKFAIVKKRAA